MRAMFLGSAAAGLFAVLLTLPAHADRVCNKVCHAGVCKSECVTSGPRLYNRADRFYHRHTHPRPGINVEINR